jgi:K+-transporting ATPase ATPase C chain
MSIVREIARAIRMFLVLWVLTAVIYPGVIFLVGQTFFRTKPMGASCKIFREKW